MARYCIVFAMLATFSLAWAEDTYRPAVPPPSTINSYGGGYSGWNSGGGTAASAAMNGMANAISAKGSYNLATSAAAINMTHAQKQYIENRQQAADTYFQMRAANRKYVAAERGPPPSMEQLARIAAQGAPKPLRSDQVDSVSGRISWPDLLQEDKFTEGRTEVEQLYTKRISYGRLDFSDQKGARQAIDGMFADLKSEVKNVPPQQYVSSRSFLQSMIYSLTKTQLD